MKLGVVTSLFPNYQEPNRGIFTLKLLQNLHFTNVTVIAPVPWFPLVKRNRKRGIPKSERISGMQVFHPKFFSIPKFFKPLDAYFFFLSLLPYRKVFKKCDLIYSSYGYPDGVGAWMFARRLCKPFSITLHRGDLIYWANQPMIRGQIAAMIRDSDSVVLVSDQLRDHLPERSIHNRIFVVSNGVDTGAFRPFDSVKAREILSLPPKSNILLTVGNSFRRKGYFELVKALNDIADPSLLLLIVGKDSEEQEDLELLIGSLGENRRVRLLGEIPNHLLPLYYSSADVYCLASYSEGWPCSVMEAFSCGKPCLVTPEAAGEFVNSEIGIVAKHPELSVGIKEAFNKKWDVQKIRAFALENSWESVAHKMERLFKIRK